MTAHIREHKVELVGGKVILRQKRLEDAWMDYLWRSDVEIAELDAAPPLKMMYEDFVRLFKDQLRYPAPASGRVGIHTKDGKYIGNCMYYDLNTVDKEAEIGIVIGDRDYWGRGYGHDALLIMIDHLFTNKTVQRLYLHTLDWNARARRAFEKCGLTPVKTVRRNGLNFIRMEIKKDRWLEIRDEQLAARDAAAQATQE